MKKTMITALVAVAAIGFSSTSFAGPGGKPGGGHKPGISIEIDDVTLADKIIEKTADAGYKAPAALGDIGNVVYGAGNSNTAGGAQTVVDVMAKAKAIQNVTIESTYAPGSLDANITAEAARGGMGYFAWVNPPGPNNAGFQLVPAGAGGSGEIGNGAITNITTGDVHNELVNTASTTVLVLGGDYSVNTQPAAGVPVE